MKSYGNSAKLYSSSKVTKPTRFQPKLQLQLHQLLSEFSITSTRVTPANAYNLSAARRYASFTDEPTVFMTRVDIKAMLRCDKKNASLSIACLNLKPLYLAEIATKPYPLEVFCFQKFDGHRGNTREHDVHFYDSTCPHSFRSMPPGVLKIFQGPCIYLIR